MLWTFALALVATPQEDLLQRLKACAATSDSLLRLGCYDALAKTSTAGPSVATANARGVATGGNWSIDESIDPLTDTPTLFALLPSSERNAAISLRCKGGETDVLLNVNKYLGSDSVVVTLRLDSEQPRKERWTISTDHKAAFAPKAFDLTAKLARAGRLVTQVAPYSSSPITSTFDLTGVGAVIEKLRRTCPTK
jgi:type VI secretion system protein VasI